MPNHPHRVRLRYLLVPAAVLALVAACAAAQPSTRSSGSGVAVQPGPVPTAHGVALAATYSPRRTSAAASLTSWNAHVVCVPVLTTLSHLLGSQRSAQGGATLAGGGFKPGIPDRRSTNPPCSVAGVPTLVELHKVTVGTCSKINTDGDWTCELTDPAIPASVPADFHSIHIEIDGNFRAKGWAPAIPPGGRLIDVQGFVFWDPDHTTAAFHHHSGWELHTFTAWRLAA
jgi:hypothetical protein